MRTALLAAALLALGAAACRGPWAGDLDSPPATTAAVVLDCRLERADRRGRVTLLENDRAVLRGPDGRLHYLRARPPFFVRDGLAGGEYTLVELRGATGADESAEEWHFPLPEGDANLRFELAPGRLSYVGQLVARTRRAVEGVELEWNDDPERERAVWREVLYTYPASPWAGLVRARLEAEGAE